MKRLLWFAASLVVVAAIMTCNDDFAERVFRHWQESEPTA